MFYIDYTTPEGRTYRIDVLKNPVHFECPVCGEQTIYDFNPDEHNYCRACVEQEVQKEREKEKELSYHHLAEFVNRKCRTNITADDMKQLEKSLENQDNPQQAAKAYFDNLIKKHTRNDQRLHPKVIKVQIKKNQ